jgi:hypothetical protein
MTTHVKNSTQRLALLWVVICHFTANAAEPVFNDFTGRAKLGDLVAQYTGYSNAVSAENFDEVSKLTSKLADIYNERITTAHSNGMKDISGEQVKVLVRVRYLELTGNQKSLKPFEKTMQDFCKEKWESDRLFVGQISDSLYKAKLAGVQKMLNEQEAQRAEARRQASLTPAQKAAEIKADETKKVMDSWIGSHKSALVQAWGAPSRTTADGKGGEIFVYEKSITLGGSMATTTSSPDFGFGRTFNTYISNPVAVVQYQEVFADPNGTIYYWRVGTR